MSGATTELNLATAVDSDDNADYLTLSLANSLRTVDGLFNNITGHNHGGAHQGGPVVPAAGSITSAMIADGTIATADLANASVTNAKLASDTARAQLLTNGGFEIWQRGNGPFTGGGFATCADRWQLNPSGTDTWSISRSASHDVASNYAAVVSFTLGSGAGNSSILQLLKASDANALAGKVVTISLRVNTTTANAVRVALSSDGTSGSTVYSSFHPGGGTYQTLSTTYTVPQDVTAFYVLILFAASCTAYLDNAMLVVGSVPADYAPLHPADDLARCLRYYELRGEGAAVFPLLSGYNAAGAATYVNVPNLAMKPGTPTVTKNGTWLTSNASQPTIVAQTPAGTVMSFTPTATGYGYTHPNGVGQSLSIEFNP